MACIAIEVHIYNTTRRRMHYAYSDECNAVSIEVFCKLH
jgi:hypothetical protein